MGQIIAAIAPSSHPPPSHPSEARESRRDQAGSCEQPAAEERLRCSSGFEWRHRWGGYRRADQLLLIRRQVAVGGLLWSFPSGKVEPGEPMLQAAAREALEEAGVVVAPTVLLGERRQPATGWRVSCVACRLLGGEAGAASPREVAEVAWVGLPGLRKLIPGGLYGPVHGYLAGALGP
jgi:8-oxo-dGTP diphosphatase